MAAENLPSDVSEFRSTMEDKEKAAIEALGPPDERIQEFYHEIPLSDGHQVRAKVFSPKGKSANDRPLILLFHGGGFSFGTCEQCTRPGREFAAEFDAVVVSTDYRLAPEHKFPQAALDGIDILEWLVRNAKETFGASPESALIVGGHSAGSQIAAVITGEACSKGMQPPVTGLFLCIPFLFTSETVPAKYKDLWTSMEENDSPEIGKKQIDNLLTLVEPDPHSPLFSPSNDPARLQLLPATYIQAGGKDILRDDAVVFERLLRDAGVPTKLDVTHRVGHAPWWIFTEDDDPNAKELAENTVNAMYWLLKG